MPSVTFQIIDIIARDEVVLKEDENTREVEYESLSEGGDDSDYESKKRWNKKRFDTEKKNLIIHIFGKTAEGRKVRLDVEGFRPSFALRIPTSMAAAEAVASIKDYVKKSCPNVTPDQIGWKIEQKKVFYGFTADRFFPFLAIDVPSIALFRRVRGLFLNQKKQYETRRALGAPWKKGQVPEVFDADLDPMLRFMHWRHIDPCGWVTADATEVDEDGGHYVSHWEDIGPCEKPPMPIAPFKKLFWDIECMSYTGEFPLAIATYNRAAKEILNRAISAEDAARLVIAAFKQETAKPAGMTYLRYKGRKAPDLDRISSAMQEKTVAATIERMISTYGSGDKEVREKEISALNKLLGRVLGAHVALAGDEVIQIGCVVASGDKTERHLFAYPDCGAIAGATVHAYATESAMLIGFCKWLVAQDPDELVGYNVFGFDERYFHERMSECGLTDLEDYQRFNRLSEEGGELKLDEKRLASSAMGDNMLYTWTTQGRLQIDLLHYVRRNANLASYTLDNVTHHYLSADVVEVRKSDVEGAWIIKTKAKIKEAKAGRAVVLIDAFEETVTSKLEVVECLDGNELLVMADEDADWDIVRSATKCSMGKDDLPPKEIFRHQLGGPEERAVIGKYCIQDCDLVLDLYRKLETFANAMAMANICSVPVSYIFTRGQGIKAESLMFREAWRRNQRIQVMESPSRNFGDKPVVVIGEDGEEEQEAEDSYEGAIVLTPVPGLYRNVGVCDFASLYPSTIVSENISHDSIVWAKDYTLEGKFIGFSFGSEEYDKLEGWRYTDIEFDILKPDPADKRKNPRKIKAGLRICRYAQPAGDQKSTVPQVIQMLLAARKAKRKEAEAEPDPARAALLDVAQLNYKLTANSLYGQLGSATFKVRLQHLAASITAYGRKQIMSAKAIIEHWYGPREDGTWKDPRGKATVVYGDTDSLFIGWDLAPGAEDGVVPTSVPARVKVIELTKEAGELVTQVLAPPHDFEYEKVFDPMLLYTKKRYAGNKYEFDPTKFKLTSMGIATKRRDYAPIVKSIYSGALKRLLDHQDVVGATKFVQDSLLELVNGGMSWSQLTITKSLRSDYAKPKQIAHKVLADRIAVRDPGNAPASGDRIGYIFIRPGAGQEQPELMGDRIETPTFAREHKLTPDYYTYMENQISKPVSQMFALVASQMPGYEVAVAKIMSGLRGKKKKAAEGTEEDPKMMEAVNELIAKDILFSQAFQKCSNLEMKSFFQKQFKMTDEQVAKATTSAAAAPKRRMKLAPEVKKEATKILKQSTMDYMFDTMLLKRPRAKKSPSASEAGAESVKE